MEITTIKLQKNTKSILDRSKQKNESYDLLLRRILRERQTKELEQQLAKGYKNSQLHDEWNAADAQWK